jgi:hypothetical protein
MLGVSAHRPDLGQHRLITHRARRGRPIPDGIVRARSDRNPVLAQHAADRLDSEPVS